MNEDTKKRVRRVLNAGQTLFQWGFIPTILYLGREQWIYSNYNNIQPNFISAILIIVYFFFLSCLSAAVGFKQGPDPQMPEFGLLRYVMTLSR